MFRTLFVKNFRCFRELTLGSPEQPLARVNLIAGKNNTGKTALLEALFLFIGPNNPELTLRIHVLRGIPQIDAQETWEWLFFDRHCDRSIELVADMGNHKKHSLTIRLAEAQVSRSKKRRNGKLETSNPVGSITTATPKELMLDYDDGGPSRKSRAFVNDQGIQWERAPVQPYPLGIFLTPRARFLPEDIERYSRLAETGQQKWVLEILKLVEPRLRGLGVLVTSAGVPVLYGDVGLRHLVPLPLMGEGLARLFSILVAILRAPGGTVLLDEVENGLHYSVMQDVWRAIAQAAQQSNVQVFATTHSWECIRAAHHAFKADRLYEFRYHRLDRLGEDIVIKTFSEKMLNTVEQSDLEVR